MSCNLERCPFTLNTTRICANNPINTAIAISKIGFTSMKPNAVILINKNEVFDGVAATPLVHFPINAAILFTDGKKLSKETLNQIKRLSPKGHKGIHVILVGNISRNVSLELKDYGFRTHHIAGRNHYETACMIPSMRAEFKNILIMSGEDYSEGIIAGYWSAHHGDPILYVQKDKIPCCTLEVIKKMNHINIYIIGSTKTISKAVERSLSKLDNVKRLDRIDGDTPYDIAVNFAKYKDSKTEFGWARNYKEGHAFTFGDLKHPMEIIAGVLFAHMGKHTPLLLTRKDMVPKVVERYIKSIKPMPPKNMPMPPFMHGFILGGTENISYDSQVMIEDILSIDHEMTGMDMDHENAMKHSDHMHMHHMHMMHHDMNEKHDEDENYHDMMDMDHENTMQHSNHMHIHHMHMMHHDTDEKHDEDKKHHEMMHMDHENTMQHSDHMHMHHMHMMHHDEDENQDEIIHNSDHRCEHLNLACLTVSIDEIIN